MEALDGSQKPGLGNKTGWTRHGDGNVGTEDHRSYVTVLLFLA